MAFFNGTSHGIEKDLCEGGIKASSITGSHKDSLKYFCSNSHKSQRLC